MVTSELPGRPACTLTLIAMQGHQTKSKNRNNVVHHPFFNALVGVFVNMSCSDIFLSSRPRINGIEVEITAYYLVLYKLQYY